MRLGFVQLDILSDGCLKDDIPKIGADILENLVRESRPTIEERRDDTSNLKVWMIEAPFDALIVCMTDRHLRVRNKSWRSEYRLP
jgi:hypothetical protein